MVRIRGIDVDVDVTAEIQKYDWQKPRWSTNNFYACSPFREDRHPSFSIRLDSGVWIDGGGVDEEWKKGNFIKILSFLRNETYEETQDYLLSTYGFHSGSIDSLELSIHLAVKEERMTPISMDMLLPYRFRHPYLAKKRGIMEKTQRLFQVGYDKKAKAITLPWLDKQGQLVNIKFRSVHDKRFWYSHGGSPIRNHLYGLHLIHRYMPAKAYLVESEIDAMTLWQMDCPAI
ncbi:DNA primase, partial [Heliobacterium chlorum]